MFRLSRQLFFRPLARYQHHPPKVSHPAHRFQTTFRRLTMAFVFSCGTVYTIKYYLQKDKDDNDKKGQGLQRLWPFSLLGKNSKMDTVSGKREPIAFPRKVFNDPIHGPIALHDVCVAIVNTPQFQRLRNIKQLGGGYFVYPAASHNRFEHSIGVCHLAGELIRALQKNQPELKISDKDVLCVEIAGLCHDLGHGPFSHVFDSMVIPRVPQDDNDAPNAPASVKTDSTPVKEDRKTWKHENASIKMFDYIVENNPKVNAALQKEGLKKQDIEFVKNMICPDKMEEGSDGRGKKNKYFYEIVANKQSEVDVDKWDYFARDCHHLGMRSSFDHKRYIHFARVLEYDGEMRLCMRDKEVFNTYQLFQTRHALHKKAYKHRVTNAVECMIADILIAAKDEELVPTESSDTEGGPAKTKRKIQDCIDHMDAYTNLNDDILQLIRASKKKSLKRSQELLKALYRRELYSCVAETRPFTIDVPEWMKPLLETPEKLTESLAKDSQIPKERIFVQEVKLDFGKKIKNPVDEQLFYTKGPIQGQKPRFILQNEVSLLVPKEIFQEQLIRIYLKQDWTKRSTPEEYEKECKILRKHAKALFRDYFLAGSYEDTQGDSQTGMIQESQDSAPTPGPSTA